MSLCKYKDVLGKVGQGVHGYRFLGVAIVDVIATLVLAGVIAYFARCSVILVFSILIVVAIVVHAAFCVDTALNVFIFSTVLGYSK